MSRDTPLLTVGLALRLVSFAGELVAAAVLELAALAIARTGTVLDSPPPSASGRVPVDVGQVDVHRHSAQIPAARHAGTVVVVPTYDEDEAHAVRGRGGRFAGLGYQVDAFAHCGPDQHEVALSLGADIGSWVIIRRPQSARANVIAVHAVPV